MSYNYNFFEFWRVDIHIEKFLEVNVTWIDETMSIARLIEQKGIEKGIQKGMNKGLQRGQRSAARSMLDDKFDLQTIAKPTGLSLAEI